MAQTDRTYIAFFGNGGEDDPAHPDSDLFHKICTWSGRKNDEFWFTHRDDKAAVAAFNLKHKEVLRADMASKLKKSRNVLVVLGKPLSMLDKRLANWVDHEISYAVDECKLPLIIAYTAVNTPIIQPRIDSELASYWPNALQSRVTNQIAGAIHIPFQPGPLKTAVDYFSPYAFPNDGSLGWYTEETYASWDLLHPKVA